MKRFEPNFERIRRDIIKMSDFTLPEESGYTRISFSLMDRQARKHIALLMEDEAKLTIRIDPAGNLIGRREGRNQEPAILLGSHIDTVRGGGRFDGIAGVIAGIEVGRRFEEEGIRTIHPLEVAVFLAEEPSPFGISTIGSRAMVGKLSPDLLSSLRNNEGSTLGMAIREMGGDPERITEAKRSSGDIFSFLELHIEQGPLLSSRGIPIGVVTGIVGIVRGEIEVVGRNDHAGTTPMWDRKDALAAGAEVVLALEGVCKELDGIVGTIGKIEISPNSLNVIPGTVILGMEIRSLRKTLLNQAISFFKDKLDRIVNRRKVTINLKTKLSSEPVIFNSKMVGRIVRVCEKLNIPYLELPSGAGHDANHLAEITPTGMIFVPSKDGRSHCPEEWSEFENIGLGVEVLANTVIELDKEEVL